MASNSFGALFKITTWGESHGQAIGVVVDGCPSNISITEDEINADLKKRAPGNNPYTSPRKEPDKAQILSGVFEGKTTGAPISIIIPNKDADSSKYEPIKNLLRPGHANYTYQEKYGIFDYRGGGRASARETAARVASATIANKILQTKNIVINSYIKSIYDIEIKSVDLDYLPQSQIFCPDKSQEQFMLKAIAEAKDEGDSLGGIVEFVIDNLPCGLGEPIYEKVEAKLASAMLSIPASKGFEIGLGFSATKLKGSLHNDLFQNDKATPTTSNNAGGTLAGITTGMPLIGRVAFKPTSSILKPQKTIDSLGEEKEFTLPPGSRHDPCVAIRAVPVVAAMCKLVIADLILLNAS